MSASGISIEELFAEMSKAEQQGRGEGKSASEIVQATGLSREKVWRFLGQQISLGTMCCERGRRIGIDGTPRPVPLYRVIAKNGKKR